jgi:hypothetical protein
VTVLRIVGLFSALYAVARLSELIPPMATIGSWIMVLGYLDWVGQGRPRFVLRGSTR